MSSLEPAYLLLGPETGTKNAFIQEVREGLHKKHREKPEEYRLYAFETGTAEVVDLLRNSSLFASAKLVLFQGAEEIKKKDEVSLLLEYLKNPSKDNVLLLVSEKTSVEKKLQDAFPQTRKKIFWELFDNQKKSWVISCFHRYKLRITPDAADLFLEVVENNTQDLERECASLSLFFGENSEIASKDIETYLFHAKQETVFSLFEAAAASKNLTWALEILDKLLLEGDSQPVQLLAGLLWQFRNLFSYKLLLARNYQNQEIFTKLKILSKRNQRIYSDAQRNFTLRELEDIIAAIADFDEDLRSVRTELQKHLFSLFLYTVIDRKGKGFLRPGRDDLV